MSLSLVIITDGAHLDNLKKTIDSVGDLAQEKLIVYQGHDESTYAQIQALADFSVSTTPKGNADLDRNFAYGIASSEWILALDDDEWVPEDTKTFISQIMQSKTDIVWFNFKNLIDGVDVKDVLGDDPHPRLWRKRDGVINWPNQAHTFPSLGSPLQYMSSLTIVHDRRFDEIIERHEKRMKVMDSANIDLEKRFIAAVKQKLGRK